MKTIEETNGHGIPCGSSPTKEARTNVQTSGYVTLYKNETDPAPFNWPNTYKTTGVESSAFKTNGVESAKNETDPAWSFDAPRNPVTDALNLLEREIREKSERDLAESLEELAKIRERLTR